MTALYVESRPFPGAPEPGPRPDLTAVAGSALAAARRQLDNPSAPVEHSADCRCSVWCRDEWTYAGQALGPCSVCGEPCRSTDPEGRVRHPTCEVA
jgi:hypothetical protein